MTLEQCCNMLCEMAPQVAKLTEAFAKLSPGVAATPATPEDNDSMGGTCGTGRALVAATPGATDPAAKKDDGKVGETKECVFVVDGANRLLAAAMVADGLTAEQAAKLSADPAVARVWEDRARTLRTNASANYLGLLTSPDGLRTPLGLKGEDVVIGVIDSGIATAPSW